MSVVRGISVLIRTSGGFLLVLFALLMLAAALGLVEAPECPSHICVPDGMPALAGPPDRGDS